MVPTYIILRILQGAVSRARFTYSVLLLFTAEVLPLLNDGAPFFTNTYCGSLRWSIGVRLLKSFCPYMREEGKKKG